MAEPTDDELKEAGLLARVRVDYAAAGCTSGSAMGRQVAAAAERRALYEQGRRQALDEVRTWAVLHDTTGDLLAKLGGLRTPPLSCGCPPEHHDEAVRRLTDIMRRDGAITEES